nr:hypothetical protein [Tanacetum cinerariifolium]
DEEEEAKVAKASEDIKLSIMKEKFLAMVESENARVKDCTKSSYPYELRVSSSEARPSARYSNLPHYDVMTNLRPSRRRNHGSSSTPIYSSGSSTPSRYSSGASTPQSYSPRSSRNAKCSNCKHLLDKITMATKGNLGRLLPHARGLGFKPRRGGFPSGAKKEWGLSPKAKVRVLHTAQLDVTARQDLQRLGIQSGLWLGQTKNGKCLKPHAACSFTPEDQKMFCQFIKGVKLSDGFGSCFKHKVTDNATNITGLKSHDCHIMMQRLLPYGLQNYLPDKIAKPIIELCSLFKQICSTTLTEDDMLKAQIKMVDNLCDLELMYPPALFDIMIHLVIHLPLETLEGGPIRPRWMFSFEIYMKKLKGYVRNKAKPEDSIAKGYVAEEALTFIDGVRYVVHNRDERRTTQNSGICSPGPDGEIYYGQLQEILEFKYLLFKVVLFRVKRFDTRNQGHKFKRFVFRNNMTQIDTRDEAFKNDQYILITQVKQVFYIKDKAKPHWKVVEHVNRKKFSDGGVIVVEDDPDIIHFDNSSDLPLSTSLNDLDNATLHIDGQSTKFDAPQNIINTQFDLRLHIESLNWTVIEAGIQQHLQKAYNTNKAAFKAQHWVIDTKTGSYNAEKIKRAQAEPTTQEYPSLIDTFFIAHTVDGVFTQDEDRLIYEEMRRLEATSTYTDDEINRLAKGGKQQGHILGVGRVLPARATASPKFESGGASGSGGCGDDEESADDKEDEDGDDDS